MSDVLTKEQRRRNMQAIRCRDTKPERAVRSALHRMGFRFRLASGQRLFGKPDIVLPKYHIVIFVHGCFWHRHRSCGLAYTPKTRVDFWSTKFAANVKRDAKVRRRLRQEGWNVIVVWECELDNLNQILRRVVKSTALRN